MIIASSAHWWLNVIQDRYTNLIKSLQSVIAFHSHCFFSHTNTQRDRTQQDQHEKNKLWSKSSLWKSKLILNQHSYSTAFVMSLVGKSADSYGKSSEQQRPRLVVFSGTPRATWPVHMQASFIWNNTRVYNYHNNDFIWSSSATSQHRDCTCWFTWLPQMLSVSYCDFSLS